MKNKFTIIIAILVIIGAIVAIELANPRSKVVEVSVKQDIRVEEKFDKYEIAKEITTPDGYINTESISIGDLIGKKVILIDFWTYSCINCQRTFPYINAWYEKYKGQGLEVIGIHTPEFKFEHDYDNVVDATKRFELRFPVVLDNDFSTWRAYRNQYWPRKYLIDIDGFIVYDHIGEGGYDKTEQKIQELLEERKLVLGVDMEIDSGMVKPTGVEEVVAGKQRSPETYFGAWRNENFAGEQGVVGAQKSAEPEKKDKDILYLTGEWDIKREFAENLNPGAKIIFKYSAEKVFIVASSDNGARVRILRDGELLGDARGVHVSDDSTLTIQNDQLYRLIEDPDGFGEHTLEIIIEDPGLQVFTFTFG